MDINEVIRDDVFLIYPNLAFISINVRSNSNLGIFSLILTDVNGKIVKQSSLDNLNNGRVNIADLSVGIYFVKIASSKVTAVRKIIKK